MKSTDYPGEGQGARRAYPGARKITPESLAAQQGVRAYAKSRTLRIKRTQALQLAKRAAAAMRLGAAKIALLDKLFGCSPAADWDNPEASPIVWPSNATLASKLGLSESTTRHHLRGLVAVGLIAQSSHPTFQRRGLRDRDGRIVEAYGIDLSPIITRYDELLELAEAYEYEAAERRRLGYRRTTIRRDIEAILDSARKADLDGPWQQIQAQLDALREASVADLDVFRGVVEALEALRDDAESAFEDASLRSDLDTAVAIYRRVQTTADESPYSDKSKTAFEKKPEAISRSAQESQRRKSTLADDVQHISLSLVRDACPSIVEFVPNAFESWSALRDSWRGMCAVAAINPQVWQEAQSQLGPDIAISALAVTVQKYSDGIVENPGAYLRSLVKRGRAGELFISRSLFALAKDRLAAKLAGSAAPRASGFPKSGSIGFGRWAEIVRRHAPAPAPDADIVAQAFRGWATSRGIDLDQPSIEKTFATFCTKWRPN